MSQDNPIRVFVSHLYAPDDEYLRVFEYLESAPNFFYTNLSTPDDPPPKADKEGVKEHLRKQMANAEIVVMLASLYDQDHALVEFQALYAKACNKPVMLMESFGQEAKLPAQLRELADEVIPWNSRDMADAVRRLARHEDTGRWDVVEFKLD